MSSPMLFLFWTSNPSQHQCAYLSSRPLNSFNVYTAAASKMIPYQPLPSDTPPENKVSKRFPQKAAPVQYVFSLHKTELTFTTKVRL